MHVLVRTEALINMSPERVFAFYMVRPSATNGRGASTLSQRCEAQAAASAACAAPRTALRCASLARAR
jgi:hypothetical protein